VLPPSQCRSIEYKQWIDGVLGIVPINVKPFLRKAFGWNLILDSSLIGSRIDVIVSSGSSYVQSELLSVLQYLQSIADIGGPAFVGEYILKVKSHITSEAWLPGLIEGLWPPDRVFAQGARDFQPYMSELPLAYWRN